MNICEVLLDGNVIGVFYPHAEQEMTVMLASAHVARVEYNDGTKCAVPIPHVNIHFKPPMPFSFTIGGKLDQFGQS